MQNKITKSTPLLNKDGELNVSGYATKPLFQYQRSQIQANSLRIKEWDYYLIYNQDFALCLTIADNSYMGLDSISFIDFSEPSETTVSKIRLFPKGTTNLPSSSKIGDVSVVEKGYSIQFLNDGKERILNCSIENFADGHCLTASITLTEEPEDSMVIAVPFEEDKKAFYYNQKIVGLKANGIVEYKEKRYAFTPETSYAIFDWGRGVWPYHNTWYWSSACANVSGHLIGFNLGYGFGNTSAATENMLFIDGKSYKLNDVSFDIPMEDGKELYLDEWKITSTDQRIQLDFKPIIDRASATDAVFLSSHQHQVFGRFNGYIVLETGERVLFKDFLGFAEKVVNKW